MTIRHRLSGTVEWVAWKSLRQRCNNKFCKDYPKYGGRGITVDPLFDGPEGFINFLREIGPRPGPEYSVERIDNEKGYAPGNIKWATDFEQNNNRRPPGPYKYKSERYHNRK